MTSHEYAHKLNALADFLLSRPVFDLPTYQKGIDQWLSYFSNKDGFLAAFRALSPGKKEYTEGQYGELKFTPDGVDEKLGWFIKVSRSVVCTLVKPAQPAVYDCEPLLSAAEEAEMHDGSTITELIETVEGVKP